MKTDAYMKTLATLIVVCLILLCVAHMRLAASAQKAVALTEDEQNKRRELEQNIAEALTPKYRRPTGFTAQPFATI